MLQIYPNLDIPDDEVEISAVRAQGPGGQNVNKVASAAHLRFDIPASSLPDWLKQRLLQLSDRRITAQGVVVIKARRFRTLEKNIADGRQRLLDLVSSQTVQRRKRIPTRPTRASRERRLQTKTRRGEVKQLRGKIR
jgi:ribosome-associated protein